MSFTYPDTNALGERGMAALGRGDWRGARDAFSAIIAAGEGDGTVHTAIALAHQGLGDKAAMGLSLDQALSLEPQNVRALLMKGDLVAERGDRRGAVSFYAKVLELVPDTAGLPPEAAREIGRARDVHDRLNREIFGGLHDHLRTAGIDAEQTSPRFAAALDLLSGKTQRYVQQPRSFFFPELPDIQFYPREMFPWMDALEAATDDIRAELVEVMKDPTAFAPYVEAEEGRPTDDAGGLLDNDDWSACYLWRDGAIVPGMAERCPKTLAALEGIPLERIAGRSPFVLFSKLSPGARIAPHTGFHNTRLVCHLPLIVPPGCMFRVGNDVREWEAGKAWAFNDTIEHEAHNASDALRVVLIFNIWRPELTQAERRGIATLMEGIAGV